MNLSLNPVKYWRSAPRTIQGVASILYAAMVLVLVSVITGWVTLPVAGWVAVVGAVITAYILWDSATIVLKGGRVGSVVAVAFAAAVLAYLGTRADSAAGILFGASGVTALSMLLLFTAPSREYHETRSGSIALDMLKSAREQKKNTQNPETSNEAAESGGTTSLTAPMNRQQRRAYERAQRSKGSSKNSTRK